MTTTVSCAKCNQPLLIPDRPTGPVQCPKCGQPVALPARDSPPFKGNADDEVRPPRLPHQREDDDRDESPKRRRIFRAASSRDHEDSDPPPVWKSLAGVLWCLTVLGVIIASLVSYVEMYGCENVFQQQVIATRWCAWVLTLGVLSRTLEGMATPR